MKVSEVVALGIEYSPLSAFALQEGLQNFWSY